MLKNIAPREVMTMLRAGKCRLVDIREPDEVEAYHVQGAESAPLSVIRLIPITPATEACPIVFTCHSGRRVGEAAHLLETLAKGPAYALEGGMEAWLKAALPLKRGQKYSLDRQIRIAAGSIVLLGSLLSLACPLFLIVPLFVGAGLVFAGLTGFCGLGKLLSTMPWNNRTR